MVTHRCLFAAILFVCQSCFAQAPSQEVQVPPVQSANSAIKLADATPVVLRTKEALSSATA